MGVAIVLLLAGTWIFSVYDSLWKGVDVEFEYSIFVNSTSEAAVFQGLAIRAFTRLL
jgi:hypothetical protein